MRIDYYIKSIYGYDKKTIQDMIKRQEIYIDDKLVSKMSELVTGNVYINHILCDEDVHIYIMLNKPDNCISDIHDEYLKSLVNIKRYDSLRIMGRLDIDTTGLLILTNDTRLIKSITMPGSHDKTYLVTTKYKVNDLTMFSDGIIIDTDVKCLPAKYEIIDDYHVKLTIKEGKYHQVKKMFKSAGNEVVELKRIAINDLYLDDSLKEGEFRYLTKDEIMKLKGE